MEPALNDGRTAPMMAVDEAVIHLRSSPATAPLMHDSYLDQDVSAAIVRFCSSAEWAEVQELIGARIRGATVMDLGAGIGMASAAFLADGAAHVIAVEPDPSDVVGHGAMRRAGVAAEVVSAMGEALPLADATVDIAYCRQVLHHATDLDALVREVARVLRPGGIFLACREHVVSDASELGMFLAAHPVNRLAGGEHAFTLAAYETAIRRAGLYITKTIGPLDSVITAYPLARSRSELARLHRSVLSGRLGVIGDLIARLPGMRFAYRRLARRRGAGRMFAFLAAKPA